LDHLKFNPVSRYSKVGNLVKSQKRPLTLLTQIIYSKYLHQKWESFNKSC
jgi:hypothetical protein